jgi:hypothetical protein
MRRSVVLAFFLGLVACGPGAPSHPGTGGPDAGTGGSCSQNGATTCVGNDFETCTGGSWTLTQSCPNACDATKGCVQCVAGGGNVCNGDTVVMCNSDGTFGSVVQTCQSGETCAAGMCSRSCTADGVDLIYVVDDNNELLSFDPRLIAQGANAAFKVIGTMSCPAGASWPDWNPTMPGPATPFSMGIDRNAVAWVLYTSGEIFNVSTKTAACSGAGLGKTAYTPGQNSMELFGMGFVTDSQGGNTEKLYLGGGDVMAKPGGKLTHLDPASPMTATPTGTLPNDGELSPELTGTGAAEFFGFFPGINSSFVVQLDKNTGAEIGSKWDVGGLGSTVAAWAFAQWGGDFYVFVSTDPSGTGTSFNSTVRRVNRATKKVDTIFQNLPYKIVGAGVSTCAPTVVN